MRSRVFADSTTDRSYEWYYTSPSENFEARDTIPYRGSFIRKEMRDVVTPQFHREQANGRIINSPKFKEELVCNQFASTYEADCVHSIAHNYRFTRNGGLERVGLTMPSSLINDPSRWYDAFEEHRSEIDLAITRAHANVDVSEMMLLATMGELPETLRWIQSILTRIRAVTTAFAKRREVAACLQALGTDLLKASVPKGKKKAQQRLDIYR